MKNLKKFSNRLSNRLAKYKKYLQKKFSRKYNNLDRPDRPLLNNNEILMITSGSNFENVFGRRKRINNFGRKRSLKEK